METRSESNSWIEEQSCALEQKLKHPWCAHVMHASSLSFLVIFTLPIKIQLDSGGDGV